MKETKEKQKSDNFKCSDISENKKTANISRQLCFFVGFFALAFPAFSILLGRCLHAAMMNVATFYYGKTNIANSLSIDVLPRILLDNWGVLSWSILIIGIIAALFSLLIGIKNKSKTHVDGVGRLFVYLITSVIFSFIYLGTILLSFAYLLQFSR